MVVKYFLTILRKKTRGAQRSEVASLRYIGRVLKLRNMYVFARLVFIILTITAGVSFAEDHIGEQSTTPLQCYICAIEHDNISLNQSACFVTSSNVKLAQCAKHHGYDRCIYYRSRSVETGTVLLRRQCATQEMCQGGCLFSNHTNCQMKCCQEDMCNDWLFESGDEDKWPTTAAVKEQTTGLPTTAGLITTAGTTNIPVTQEEQDKRTKGQPVGGPKVTQSNDCKEYREECQKYAALHAYCQYNRDFMMQHCQVSCGFCEPSGGGESAMETSAPTTATAVPYTTKITVTKKTTTSISGNGAVGGPQDCRDQRTECGYYASMPGYCFYFSGFMLNYCPRSCNYCDNVAPELPRSPVKFSRKSNTTPFGPGATKPFVPGDKESTSGCLDLRENCTYYAKEEPGYCDYNKEFMSVHCGFSCGFCGSTLTSETGVFPHPPVFHDQAPKRIHEDFPVSVTSQETRWLAFQCSECHQGYKRCNSTCILLLHNGAYEPTTHDTCLTLLGKPHNLMRC